MKKLLLLAFLSLAVAGSARASMPDSVRVQKPDTLAVIEKPQTVTVVLEGNTTSITVNGSDDDDKAVYNMSTTVDVGDGSIDEDFMRGTSLDIDIPFVGHSSRHATFMGTFLQDIYFGALIPHDAPAGVKTFLEGGVSSLVGGRIQPWRKGPMLDLGFGMGWKTLAVTDGMRLDKIGESLVIVPLQEGAEQKTSYLHMFHFTIPVMLTQNIYKGFGISAGVMLNLNTYATATTSYAIGNTLYHEKYKGLHQRFFTCDFVGKLGFTDAFQLYFKYSPTSLFKGADGPNLSTISAGVVINL